MPNGNDVYNLADGWLELDSDPGLFTLLLQDFGVQGVQVSHHKLHSTFSVQGGKLKRQAFFPGANALESPQVKCRIIEFFAFKIEFLAFKIEFFFFPNRVFCILNQFFAFGSRVFAFLGVFKACNQLFCSLKLSFFMRKIEFLDFFGKSSFCPNAEKKA